jgi:hypothetical protein
MNLQKDLEKKYPKEENLIKRAIKMHISNNQELNEKEYIEMYDLISSYINSWERKRTDSIDIMLNPMINIKDN